MEFLRAHPELIHDLIHFAGIVLTAFVGSGWYRSHTNLVQRAYLSVLNRAVDKKLNEIDKAIDTPTPVLTDVHTTIVGKVLATTDATVLKAPAVKAALDGDLTQMRNDIDKVVKARYVGRGMTAKGG